MLNGPEDNVLDWFAIDWRTMEDDVRRLRQRIFTASQEGDLKRVRMLANLQGLLEPDARKRARPVLRGPGAAMRLAYPATAARYG